LSAEDDGVTVHVSYGAIIVMPRVVVVREAKTAESNGGVKAIKVGARRDG
jgi:hypothetical protein